jgi:hypothetical protein
MKRFGERDVDAGCWLLDQFEPVFHLALIHSDRKSCLWTAPYIRFRGPVPNGKLAQILLKLNSLRVMMSHFIRGMSFDDPTTRSNVKIGILVGPMDRRHSRAASLLAAGRRRRRATLTRGP